MNERDYDAWRLEHGYNEFKETYETDLCQYFGDNEDTISKFEEEVKELAKSYGLREN